MDILIVFLIILLLVFINGLFVAAEFAIIGVRPSRVEQLAEEGNRTAVGIREVVRAPQKVDRYIATAQLGITLASLGLGMYGEPSIAHHLEPLLKDTFHLGEQAVHTVSFIIGMSVVTFLHVVLGEMIPKSLALQNAERAALILATPMRIIQSIFSLAVTLLNKLGVLVLRIMRVPTPSQGSRLHTPDDLELIVADSFVGGALEAQEQRLVTNIFDFSERRVSQIMTPRVRIEAVPLDITEADLMQQMLESPHSRCPVYEGTLDNIIGVLHLKDFVRQQMHHTPFDLRDLLHEPPIVPESAYAEDVLLLLRNSHVHMAVVIDEFAGTAGIVTLEDLIEEVVGEVRDEFDTEEDEPIRTIAPGHLLVQGYVSLAEIDDLVTIGDHDHDVESVGGLVLAELNRPPQVGDEVALNGVTYRVEAVDGFSIERVSIRFAPPGAEEADED